MKKSIFNALAIFISIFGSFAVERYISKINVQNLILKHLMNGNCILNQTLLITDSLKIHTHIMQKKVGKELKIF